MLNKIKNIFKDEELEKEIQDLRQNQEVLEKNLSEKEFLYSELLRINTQTIQKNKDLEGSLVRERERNQNLKDEYVKKIVSEMDLNKELKNEKQELEKQILDLKAEFPKLEAAYSEEYQNRLKAKLKIEEEKFKEKVLELQNEYSVYFIKETEKFKLKLESVEKEKNELYVKDKEVQKKFEREKLELQEMLVLEKSAKENLSKEILDLKDKITNLKDLEVKLSEVESLYLSEILLKENLEKNLDLIEREKSELQKTLEQEKNEKLKTSEEIELLKNDILKFEEAYSNEILDKKKVLKELKDLEIVYENLEEDIVKEIKQKESLDEELMKAKIEIEKYRSKEYEMTKLNEKLLEEIKELKINVIKSENFKLEDNSEKMKITQETENLYSKEGCKQQDSEEKLENKKIEQEVEQVIQNPIEEIKSNWADKEKFLDSKDDLLGLLKTFEAKDFMEMYLEGKKRGILKSLKDKDFTNIMTRLKLKLPLTDMNLEKIENFYEELMNSMHSQESSLIEENLESNKDNEKDINLEDENKFEREEFDIESYTAKDWCRFYEIAKDFKVKDYLQKAIITLWKYEERDLMISDSQYATIRRNYSELYEVIKKFESEKNGVQKNYLKNISEDKENTLHEKSEENIEKVVEDDYRWNNYEVYSLNKSNLIPVILRFSLLDFQEMFSIGSKNGILNEMEKRQMANIITWVKLSTPLIRLNLEKIEVIYKKMMVKLFEKNHTLETIPNSFQQDIEKKPENEIVIYDDVLSVKNEEESEIQEKLKENIIKNFNSILEIGLKDGIINMKDLQEVNFDSEDDVYDIYEAVEILEERGIRINY